MRLISQSLWKVCAEIEHSLQRVVSFECDATHRLQSGASSISYTASKIQNSNAKE